MEPELGEPVVVEREAVAVQCVRAADGIEDIRRAWAELESRLGDLRGRRFYGAFDAGAGEYRACVEMREDDTPLPGLEDATLPGGRYLRLRLRGEPPAVYDLIPPGFDELLGRAEVDPTRPGLEHYRRHDEIDLLLPIR